jgi:hypothetical protein
MRRALPRGGLSTLALLLTATVGVSVGSGGFTRSIYPPPVRSRGGALTACPNPQGLQAVTAAAVTAAVKSATRFSPSSRAFDLRGSDRAWWPLIRRVPEPVNEVVDGSEPLTRSGYSVIVRFSCGSSLVSKSLEVTVGPRSARCDACRSQLFFVDRRGHALLYYVY